MTSSLNFGAAFLAGVVSFISPCVLPIVPVLLTYITGVSYEELAAVPAGRRRWIGPPLFHVLCFVGGFSLVFVALGAGATVVGQLLLRHQRVFTLAGGVLVMFLGFFMLGLLPLGFLQRDARIHLRRRPAGYAGSVLVGATFGFGWTPCIGPILGAILVMASRTDVARGTLMLGVYSLGLAIPFVLSALLFQEFLGFFRRVRGMMRWVEKVAGAVLVLVGALMALGQFSRLSTWFLQISGPWGEWLMRVG